IEVMRSLWSGKSVTWQGDIHRLQNAQLSSGPHEIPIWISSRGPLLLKLAGREADGLLLTVKPDLDAAFRIATTASQHRAPPDRIYLGRIAYTPEMFNEQRHTMPYVLKDSPERVLLSLGFDEAQIRRIFATDDAAQLDDLVDDELLARYQIHGTPQQCSQQIAALTSEQELDILMVDVLSENLDENVELLHNTYNIITDGRG
ncbi:MAG: LLM class flavin-dependent oxidoreductase, partial [Acidimicrobiales bacterium]